MSSLTKVELPYKGVPRKQGLCEKRVRLCQLRFRKPSVKQELERSCVLQHTASPDFSQAAARIFCKHNKSRGLRANTGRFHANTLFLPVIARSGATRQSRVRKCLAAQEIAALRSQ